MSANCFFHFPSPKVLLLNCNLFFIYLQKDDPEKDDAWWVESHMAPPLLGEKRKLNLVQSPLAGEADRIMQVVRWLTSLASDLERTLAADYMRQFANYNADTHEPMTETQSRIQRVSTAILNSTRCGLRVAKPLRYDKTMADIARIAGTLKSGSAPNESYNMGFQTLHIFLQVNYCHILHVMKNDLVIFLSRNCSYCQAPNWCQRNDFFIFLAPTWRQWNEEINFLAPNWC